MAKLFSPLRDLNIFSVIRILHNLEKILNLPNAPSLMMRLLENFFIRICMLSVVGLVVIISFSKIDFIPFIIQSPSFGEAIVLIWNTKMARVANKFYVVDIKRRYVNDVSLIS